MKRRMLTWFAAFVLAVSVWPTYTSANHGGPHDGDDEIALAENALSAVLIDADTGTVIYEKKSHEKLPPASITKIMTMLLTMEAIDNGTLKLTDKVTTSEYAASMGGSQIFLEPGETMTVDELLKGVAMASGNDASVALAEKIAGSEKAFVKMMNERAQQLGLKDTHFANCNGLPVADHYSSAYDIAIMSRELLKHEEITKYTGAYQDYLRQGTEKPFWLVNTNKLVRFYSGADGLKTGYTSEAKFCLAATAKRDGLRLIAVVLGEPNTKTRNSEVSAMFDYAFSQYALLPIYQAGETIGKVKVQKGMSAQLELTAAKPLNVLVKKGVKQDSITHKLIAPEKLAAPIKAGQTIGKLVVYQDGRTLTEFELTAPADIDKAGWWTLFKRTAAHLFFVDS
ncbi:MULTISPECIES: D-alanyl-D-alanine carboxypeptidase family protein [Paenibacillus]|uniref:serine-type D-Ala-D-Ala carboxypeptidase n=1 Tax=Paenibacillus barengoltzii J12 TaxID=935846 RepID=A0ABY1LU85_9BACL|nr:MULTISPECIES: D-alanyl-D-alanine carboxypeptidase family protein [Paenibacillus]EES72262.1 serine-type D-Ala-D-Ala carboxypeptidase [Paenibacillus sp. oral taxon 786 str. D14]MDU0329407.1 D-alanyl-D-alanine carboxypeptidase family protein [Paenibacillus sp. 3LSP]MEC2342695.1 D-alanyl-D-alanine carboxypeptidase [Paenibacillus barengoltzii]SMF04995.1 D-alanyl-D-alanine carboxypeptidase (penicillin-binding protein 5/6) [Paenibacillus barengoltzii J12]SMF09897.1 D-alanyl-D-alanine carboxypeptid